MSFIALLVNLQRTALKISHFSALVYVGLLAIYWPDKKSKFQGLFFACLFMSG